MSHRSPALCRSACRPDLKSSQKVLQAGIAAEDILFSKAPRSLHSSVLEFGDSYSGFRGNKICDPLRKKHTSIPCIRWTCPPKFILNSDWLLAAGDQSEERRVQEQRETGVTEVIYPHLSANPSSPSISVNVEEGHRYGHDPPIIPITPIEDDEPDSSHKVEPPPSVKENVNVKVLDQGVPTSHLLPHASLRDASVAAPKLGADIGAAASVAFTALVKSNEQGSLIDTDLLIKILSDPKMVELLKDARSFPSEKATVPHEVKQESSHLIPPALDRRSALNLNNLLPPASRDATRTPLTSEILAMLMPNTVIPSVPPPCSVPERASVALSTRAPIIPLQEDPRNCFPTPTRPQPSCLSMAAVKTTQSILDANYYKSLVRQHGVERVPETQHNTPLLNSQEASSAHNNPKPMPMPSSTPIPDKGKQKINQEDYSLKAKNNSLMGFVFGDTLDFKTVREKLLREWRSPFLKGGTQFNERGHGWFEISFPDPLYLKKVWEKRPYHVAGQILLLRPWKHDFNTATENTALLDTWIRIMRLPPVLACPKGVQQILEHNKAGTFVRLDPSTGASFTRVCANIDMRQGIFKEVIVSEPGKKDYPLPVWFEDFPKGCGNCGDGDHIYGDCPQSKPSKTSIKRGKTNPINQPTIQPVFPTKKNPKSEYNASYSKPIPPHGIKPYMNPPDSLKRKGDETASSKKKKKKRNKKANKILTKELPLP